MAAYLQEPEHYLELGAFFQAKRDRFLRALKGSRFQWSPAQGTYFQLLDYSAISQQSDVEFAADLTRKHKVASIPISVFNMNRTDPKRLRFCFAKKDETLDRAAEILRAL